MIHVPTPCSPLPGRNTQHDTAAEFGYLLSSMDVVPEPLIRSIVAAYAPRRIVLFGSRARGEAGPDSDIDLMVVLDDDAPAEALSWRRRYQARKGFPGAVDIIPCRESVLIERARAAGSFADTLLREGIVVYERR